MNKKLEWLVIRTSIVIRTGIAYSFYTIPYSMPTIYKLDKKIIALQKKTCGLLNCKSNIRTQLPHDFFGMEALSLKNAYLKIIGEQLQHSLNDKRRPKKIFICLTHYILAKHGDAFNIPRIKYHDCI